MRSWMTDPDESDDDKDDGEDDEDGATADAA
jgi:hypothetical protein